MMQAILNWIAGWQTVSASAEDAVSVLNCLQEGRFLHWHMQNTAGGGITFRMRTADAEKLCRLVPAAAAPVHGLPAWRMRYRGRWGIPVGAALFALIVYACGTVVWEVSVTGNEKLSEETVVQMLESYGFGVGTRFGDIDFDVLQNDFLLTTDDIAWIAVNMEGTVARVEIRENLGERKKRQEGSAANMIAGEDGQILEVRLMGGRAAVSRGDIVRKGELLISGVLTVGADGLRYEYADGEVLAQVNRVITAESPLTRTENVPTGREKSKKTVRFFDKSVKVFIKTGITYTNYDTIIESRQLTLPFGITLPVWITTETERELRAETVTVSEERAFADAMLLYRREMDALLSDAEILSVETERICTDGVCRIVGRAVCVADIARTAEIEVQ